MKLVPLAIAAAFLACPQAKDSPQRAPITVRLGDPAVDGASIRAYHNAWKLVGKAPDGSVKEMGTWTDDVRFIQVDGKPAVDRRQVWNYGQGTESYFNVFDPKTLAPKLSHYTNTQGVYWRLEYHASDAGVRVDYQRAPQRMLGAMSQGQVELKEPLFEFNGGMFGLLIAAFPLAEGYSARIPVFRTFDPGPEPAWVDFHVEGKERVAAGKDKEVEAWRVIVNSPATEEVMRFDLVKEPPYVIRLQQEWDGRDWTFEMM